LKEGYEGIRGVTGKGENGWGPWYTASMKRIISFDLDGTLVRGRYGDLVWNEGIPCEYAKKYALPFEEARSLIRRQYEAVGDGEVVWYNIGVWLDKFGLAVSPKELLDRYESRIELMPHALEVLGRLKERYSLVVASNAARIFVEKETGVAGITGYFDHIVSATTDYGVLKKENAFFHRLMDRLGASPEEMVHVGDHRIFDYEVPSRLGIEAYHLEEGAAPGMKGLSACEEQGRGQNGDRVIGSLRELLDRLL
jgi:HAD superfamily hydrolase (TIGR01549 family)